MEISADILKGCRSGKRAAQEQLYRLLTPRLFPVCLRFASSRSEAEDYMQESWIRIFQKIPDFRSEGSFEGWARRITVTTCLEDLRRRNVLAETTADLPALTISEDSTAISGISAAELIALIQTLPAGYRTIFNLYVMEEFTHEEIALRLGISEGTSKSQLARARQLLRDKITHLHREAKPQHTPK